MRISYLNLLKTASISTDSENANYPLENVYHIWKKKYFQAEDTTCTITATFDEISDISSVCLAYHNLTDCEVKFYDSSDTLLDTWTLDCSHETEAQYGEVADVSYCTIACTSTNNARIGVLYVGDSVYANIESDQSIPLSSSDTVVSSSDMQVSGRQGSVTRTASVTIPLLNASERKEIEYAYYECGLIKPFFLDLWDSSHDYFEPIYCKFTGELTSTHHEGYDEVEFSIQEVN